jgi:hypothetical protein
MFPIGLESSSASTVNFYLAPTKVADTLLKARMKAINAMVVLI